MQNTNPNNNNQVALTERLKKVRLTQKRLRGYFKRSKQQIWQALQPGTNQVGLKKKIETLIEKKERELIR